MNRRNGLSNLIKQIKLYAMAYKSMDQASVKSNKFLFELKGLKISFLTVLRFLNCLIKESFSR